MKKILACLCAFLSVFIVFGISGASLIQNGAFETGTLAPWVSLGNVLVEEAGLFETLWGMDGWFASLGADETRGFSALSQGFEVTGLSKLIISFDWFFRFWDLTEIRNDEFAAIVREDKWLFPITIDLLLEQSNKTTIFGDVAFGTFSSVVDISGWSLNEGARLTFRMTEKLFNPLSNTRAGVDSVSVNPVPEPATVLLIGSGLLGLTGYRKRLRRKCR